MLELSTMLKKCVFHGVHIDSLTKEQRSAILHSCTNVTQKFAPSSDGKGRVKDKLKARLVVGGNGQDRSAYTHDETSSPKTLPPVAMVREGLRTSSKRDS